MPAADAPSLPRPLLGLLEELGELKRVRSAGRTGSRASRAFRFAWAALAGGAAARDIMRADVAGAIAACRLGDLDRHALRACGMADAAIGLVLRKSLSIWIETIDPDLEAILTSALDLDFPAARVPAFVDLLADQPRAGATCPGRPRVTLEPPENHAEHCAVVAWSAVLLSPIYGADPVTVWLAGLAHHLHNAHLPDSGFAGEALLGAELGGLFAAATEIALGELPDALAADIRTARLVLADARTPEGRAFHAADTLDRVWQIAQHLRPGRITMEMILGDMALVHEGPTKAFQDHVLRDAGLMS